MWKVNCFMSFNGFYFIFLNINYYQIQEVLTNENEDFKWNYNMVEKKNDGMNIIIQF